MTPRLRKIPYHLLASCTYSLHGLARFNADAGTQPDLIVAEIACPVLGRRWMADRAAKANRGDIVRVLC
jgi:hypothetical protein